MFLKYLFIFALFSIVGWILELLYRSFKVKKIINPGFMCGCVVPIYGFAAVILTFICEILNKIETDVKIFIILILSFIILTLLELISGVLMSKIFSLKLWDYKNKPCDWLQTASKESQRDAGTDERGNAEVHGTSQSGWIFRIVPS